MFDRRPELPEHPIHEDFDQDDILPRDKGVLEAIQNEGLTVFTFDGLRRLLRMHQETLSRTLERLEEQGLVQRVPEGYRISEGYQVAQEIVEVSSPTPPLVQTMLPPGVDYRTIVSGLKGRWFGNLRWVGYTETENGIVLKWITDEEGTQLDAKFSDNLLSIESRGDEGKESADAVNASYQLLAQISRLYGRPPTNKNKMFSNVAYFPGLSFA